MAVVDHRPDSRPRFSFLLHAALTAALAFGAGIGNAAPPVSGSWGPLAAQRSTPAIPHSPARLVAISDANLLQRLADGHRQDFLIELSERADLSAAYTMNWRDRGRYVYTTLRDTAERSQAKLRQSLSAGGASIHPLWIKNAIVVRNGDLASLQRASGFAEVKRLGPLPRVQPIKPVARETGGAEAAAGISENLRWIGADRVWQKGTTGNGVTVGIIDTGVWPEHEALRAQYRGSTASGVQHDYNWFDPSPVHLPEPYLTGEHGSHVAGIVLGDNRNADPARRERIGVAPGAKWITCLGLGEDTPADVLAGCFQFMLAPTRTDGSQPDPDLRADIVNNSWMTVGTCNGVGESYYQDMVEAWVAAGVLPVFAVGNTQNCELPQPPGLSTATSPGSLAAAFTVGSTGRSNGQYAAHSLWGPTTAVSPGLPHYPDTRGFAQLKPQVVAPGVLIRSSVPRNGVFDTYEKMTGTSMSAPHVAGVFALMIEAGECLRGDYATLGTLLMQTARPLPYDSGGDPPPGLGNVPNYATGWGEIDAPAAVDAAAARCGPHGAIGGHVRDAQGRPIADATIDILVAATQRLYQLRSEPDGSYIRGVPGLVEGGYSVRVSAYGYLSDNEAGVLVQNGATTAHDVVLAAAPMHKVTGRIRDADTGWPLHARLVIGGYPGGAVWSDPLTGTYSVRLPAGTPFRFDVDSDVPGYHTATRDIADVGNLASADIALSADRTSCTAPGYAYARQLHSEGFESNGSAPPSGWSRSSAGIGWRFGDSAVLSPSGRPFPAHGRFAASTDVDPADEFGDNDGSLDYLLGPVLNLAGETTPVLRYASYFDPVSGTGSIQGSRDGGASWIALSALVGPAFGTAAIWQDLAVDLQPLAGAANARIRWHSNDNSTPKWQALGPQWGIDDVRVVGGCTAPGQGGLLIGHVRDANTSAALDGADVRVGNGPFVHSFTSKDPAVGAGFYAVYAAAGQAAVKASRGSQPMGYADIEQNVAIASGATQAADLALPAARLRLYPPGGPTADVVLGSTASVPFVVRNTGGVAAQYFFRTALLEEHFEGSFPPAGWSVVTRGNACSWARRDPVWFNYAGGNGTGAELDTDACIAAGDVADAELIAPAVDLSRGDKASVSFYLAMFMGLSQPRLDVDVSTDGGTSWTTVWTRSEDIDGFGPGRLIEIDISAYAGRSDVRVRLHAVTPSTGNFFIVDQFHVLSGVSTSSQLDLSQERGTLAAGESRELQATFDARQIAQPGVYSVVMQLDEDTPYAWPFDGSLSARMNVTAPVSYGWFSGTVRSLGSCDLQPTPLPGAEVSIQDRLGRQFHIRSDADGNYRYWLPPGDGPFSISVREADHRDSEVRSLALAAAAATTADFGLRALLPCLLTDPAAVQASVAPGQATTLALQLRNGGALGSSWSAHSGGDPAAPVILPLSQTQSPTPIDGPLFACTHPSGFTTENHFLRRFDLSQRSDPAEVVSVAGLSFAVELASSNRGTQTVLARVYELQGDMLFANMRLLREQSVQIADTTLSRVAVRFEQPLHVARDRVLVASVYSADGGQLGNAFYLGYNVAGESANGYIAAIGCGAEDPKLLASFGGAFARLNALIELDLIGFDACAPSATPVPWLGLSPASGTLAADSGTPLQATFTAGSLGNGSHRGAICLDSGAGKPVAVPVTLNIGASDRLFTNGFE